MDKLVIAITMSLYFIESNHTMYVEYLTMRRAACYKCYVVSNLESRKPGY
jgi:hypothetical protein